ncbi:hypothetical protein SAMN05192584_11019 [Streptomyces pini]|uniref:Uncharacterized protein n=2 Tax=Streptomyces pini TaxID=1520580 RepID=A0A1I4D8K4_9ACTN|nr:hypothetical protein SAMN05192584_11019 [Streptomyces pini]
MAEHPASPYRTRMRHPAELYYAPSLPPDEVRALLRRDQLLLRTCQAALGRVGGDVLGLSVEPRPGEVVVHAAVARETPEAVQNLQEIVSELKMLLMGSPEGRSDITTEVHIGSPCPALWPGYGHALVYVAKWNDLDKEGDEETEKVGER